MKCGRIRSRVSQNERNAALDIGEPISSMRIPPRGERTIIPPSSVHNISDSDCRGTKRELDSTRREIILSILYTIINFFAKKKIDSPNSLRNSYFYSSLEPRDATDNGFILILKPRTSYRAKLISLVPIAVSRGIRNEGAWRSGSSASEYIFVIDKAIDRFVLRPPARFHLTRRRVHRDEDEEEEEEVVVDEDEVSPPRELPAHGPSNLPSLAQRVYTLTQRTAIRTLVF